jgi:hypothetical protein
MIPEVHACSGYLVITGQRAYRDNAGALGAGVGAAGRLSAVAEMPRAAKAVVGDPAGRRPPGPRGPPGRHADPPQ